MASLYQIDQAILECLDEETGEIIDPEKLNALFMEKNEKIENIALWIKNLQADAVAFKAEKDAFAARQKAAEGKAESLKAYLIFALDGQKFSTARCAVSFRKSKAVQVVDVNTVPAEWLRTKTTVEPDKSAIMAALKNGQEITGCKLVENTSVQIK